MATSHPHLTPLLLLKQWLASSMDLNHPHLCIIRLNVSLFYINVPETELA